MLQFGCSFRKKKVEKEDESGRVSMRWFFQGGRKRELGDGRQARLAPSSSPDLFLGTGGG